MESNYTDSQMQKLMVPTFGPIILVNGLAGFQAMRDLPIGQAIPFTFGLIALAGVLLLAATSVFKNRLFHPIKNGPNKLIFSLMIIVLPLTAILISLLSLNSPFKMLDWLFLVSALGHLQFGAWISSGFLKLPAKVRS